MLPSFTRVPMQNADRLHCSFWLFILNALKSRSDLSICAQEIASCFKKKLSAFHLKCAPRYSYNDIHLLNVDDLIKLPIVRCLVWSVKSAQEFELNLKSIPTCFLH